MNRVIKSVLKKIEHQGYEAYIIGGYVRDFLLKIKSYDIDICTNMLPSELMALFPFAKSNEIGGISFTLKDYNFEITTYREELEYVNRKPIKINFINDLLTDLKRRDFTINTLTMNSKGIITDNLNALPDLQNKELKMVGDIDSKLSEDPLRIMRAIRLATILNFQIEPNLYIALKNNSNLINTLSTTRIKSELDKILLSKNVLTGLKLIENLNILSIKYQKVIPVSSLEGMYAQIEFNYNLPFTKKEMERIKYLKEILNESEINSYTVYKYGLELTLIASKIKELNIKEIKKQAKSLSINCRKDIKISREEIIETLNIRDQEISKIYRELEKLIISGKILNTKKNIINYLESRYKK